MRSAAAAHPQCFMEGRQALDMGPSAVHARLQSPAASPHTRPHQPHASTPAPAGRWLPRCAAHTRARHASMRTPSRRSSPTLATCGWVRRCQGLWPPFSPSLLYACDQSQTITAACPLLVCMRAPPGGRAQRPGQQDGAQSASGQGPAAGGAYLRHHAMGPYDRPKRHPPPGLTQSYSTPCCPVGFRWGTTPPSSLKCALGETTSQGWTSS